MTRKVQRVRYHLDAKGVEALPREEIVAILRGADDLIMSGGRNLLAKVLKGSQARRVLELKLEASPVYGHYRHLTLDKILARIDWVILEGYLALEYDYRLPLLVYSEKGWEIERETRAEELLRGFETLLESGQGSYDMSYLKDRNRGMILLLLDKMAATGDSKYIPLLEAWAAVDYKKVRARIREVIEQLREQDDAKTQDADEMAS
jgi:superfamily II DNA helicase RecQ